MSQPPHKRHRTMLAVAIITIAAAAAVSFVTLRNFSTSHRPLTVPASWTVVQEGHASDGGEVKPEEVEEYIKVYKAMQHNRNLTVEQAAARQHLTLAQFRSIETRIERDGVLRERVRRELLKTAEKKSNALKLPPQSAPSSSKP